MDPKTPILDGLKKEGDGFRRAEPNFFEQLAKRAEQEARPTAVRRRIRPAFWGAAAAVILLLVFAWSAIDQQSDPEPTLVDVDGMIDALTDEEIFAYIEENVADFELELLTEELEMDSYTE
ncbi:MAG: hypothetical protein AAF544_02085 [Bacteroidota bacterium]